MSANQPTRSMPPPLPPSLPLPPSSSSSSSFHVPRGINLVGTTPTPSLSTSMEVFFGSAHGSVRLGSSLVSSPSSASAHSCGLAGPGPGPSGSGGLAGHGSGLAGHGSSSSSREASGTLGGSFAHHGAHSTSGDKHQTTSTNMQAANTTSSSQHTSLVSSSPLSARVRRVVCAIAPPSYNLLAGWSQSLLTRLADFASLPASSSGKDTSAADMLKAHMQELKINEKIQADARFDAQRRWLLLNAAPICDPAAVLAQATTTTTQPTPKPRSARQDRNSRKQMTTSTSENSTSDIGEVLAACYRKDVQQVANLLRTCDVVFVITAEDEAGEGRGVVSSARRALSDDDDPTGVELDAALWASHQPVWRVVRDAMARACRGGANVQARLARICFVHILSIEGDDVVVVDDDDDDDECANESEANGDADIDDSVAHAFALEAWRARLGSFFGEGSGILPSHHAFFLPPSTGVHARCAATSRAGVLAHLGSLVATAR